MDCKVTNFFTGCFFFAFFAFMAVHFAHMKTPAQDRGIASYQYQTVRPMYDAAWKL